MKVKEYINKHYSLEQEWIKVYGEPPSRGKVFCPFHSNTETPAAKIYENTIKCFGACKRTYTLYDFLKRLNPERLSELTRATIMPESEPVKLKSTVIVNRDVLDLEKPIGEIIKDILSYGKI